MSLAEILCLVTGVIQLLSAGVLLSEGKFGIAGVCTLYGVLCLAGALG